MHEMGIILHLAKTLEETAKEEQIKKITRVTLEVGEVSGIMTDYFTDCWDYFKKRHPVLDTAALEIETIPAEMRRATVALGAKHATEALGFFLSATKGT